jgi:cytochrome P450 / NADPH-cytochrome P450 reductase
MLDVDIFQPVSYIHGFPHETFERLRREDPVHWTEESLSIEFPWAREPGPGYWAVTRHADVARVSRAPELFSAHAGTTMIVEPPIPAFLALQQLQMLNMDPPQHTQLRLIVNRAFTPKAVTRLTETIEAHCTAIIDKICEQGECEFVSDAAAELPLLVLCELLGVPPTDRGLMFDWSNRLIATADPEYGMNFADFNLACRELATYASELSEFRRSTPGDDVWSSVVHAQVDGRSLSTTELEMFFQLLVIAGNETTRNTLSNGVIALASFPDERALVVEDLALVSSAVEEILRWVSPVIRFRRTAMTDTELGGKTIHKGDKVVVYYPSANRDELVFDEPNQFDVRRRPNDHLAFGAGPHFCLGASLARMELKSMFAEILSRIPDFELVSDPTRVQSTFINGIRELPLQFSPCTRRMT